MAGKVDERIEDEAAGLETDVYRLSRTEMARLASTEYLRTFWWVVIGIPLGGLLFVVVGRGILQVVGFMALMWPFSIPARGVIGTGKSSRLFSGGVKLFVRDEALEFQGQTPGKNGRRLRMSMPRQTIRDVVRRGDFFLVRTPVFGFVPVRVAAFGPPSDADRFFRGAALRSPEEEEVSGSA